jgi:hypothetical protein
MAELEMSVIVIVSRIDIPVVAAGELASAASAASATAITRISPD